MDCCHASYILLNWLANHPENESILQLVDIDHVTTAVISYFESNRLPFYELLDKINIIDEYDLKKSYDLSIIKVDEIRNIRCEHHLLKEVNGELIQLQINLNKENIIPFKPIYTTIIPDQHTHLRIPQVGHPSMIPDQHPHFGIPQMPYITPLPIIQPPQFPLPGQIPQMPQVNIRQSNPAFNIINN